jgi:hypothetical protein
MKKNYIIQTDISRELPLKKIRYHQFHINCCKKGLFPTRPSSISLKIGIVRVFRKKRGPSFISAKKPPTKKLQGYQLLDFPRFLHHTFFNNSISFYCRNLCMCALERYFIEKNKKKTTTTFEKKIAFDDLKWN